MRPKRTKIVIELDEYDILRLLTLIRKESHQVSIPWKPYWHHLAESVETALQYGQDANGRLPLTETEPTNVRIVDETLPPG